MNAATTSPSEQSMNTPLPLDMPFAPHRLAPPYNWIPGDLPIPLNGRLIVEKPNLIECVRRLRQERVGNMIIDLQTAHDLVTIPNQFMIVACATPSLSDPHGDSTRHFQKGMVVTTLESNVKDTFAYTCRSCPDGEQVERVFGYLMPDKIYAALPFNKSLFHDPIPAERPS